MHGVDVPRQKGWHKFAWTASGRHRCRLDDWWPDLEFCGDLRVQKGKWMRRRWVSQSRGRCCCGPMG